MSDAGDEIEVDAPAAEVEVSAEAPKGKMSVEDALQVGVLLLPHSAVSLILSVILAASSEERTRTRWSRAWSTRVCQGPGQAPGSPLRARRDMHRSRVHQAHRGPLCRAQNQPDQGWRWQSTRHMGWLVQDRQGGQPTQGRRVHLCRRQGLWCGERGAARPLGLLQKPLIGEFGVDIRERDDNADSLDGDSVR